MLTKNESIEKIAYRQAVGAHGRAPTTNENIERLAYRQLRTRVRTTLQPGTINYIVGQEITAMIAEAINSQLATERDTALGRLPYERVGGSAKRNGFKLMSLPGLWGRLTLRRPAVRAGRLALPLADALKAAGTGLRDMLAMRFWLRGCSTRDVAQELNTALGAKMSHSTVTKLTNAIEPVLREWETRPVPKGIAYLLLDAIYLPVRRARLHPQAGAASGPWRNAGRPAAHAGLHAWRQGIRGFLVGAGEGPACAWPGQECPEAGGFR